MVNDFVSLAEPFQKFRMDNAQLAVLSAILIFQPEFLPGVSRSNGEIVQIDRLQNARVAQLSDELWLILQSLVEQNPAGVSNSQ